MTLAGTAKAIASCERLKATEQHRRTGSHVLGDSVATTMRVLMFDAGGCRDQTFLSEEHPSMGTCKDRGDLGDLNSMPPYATPHRRAFKVA